MFSSSVILRHLQTYLPRLTTRFSTVRSCTGTIIAGVPQVLRITLASHGYLNGATISVINAKIDNGIASVTEYEDDDGVNILKFVTTEEHDLTLGYEDNLTDGEIELRGFTDAGLNGYHELYGVSNKTTFEIAYATLPTLNGNEVLRENWEAGINDVYTISNVTTTTFDITLTDKPTFDPGPLPQVNISSGFRMDVVASFERAEQKYTKQTGNNLFLYVIMGDCLTSKDIHVDSDSFQLNTASTDMRQRLINTFNITVFWNTKDDIGGGLAVKEAWDDIFIAVLGCLQGKSFETFDKSNFVTSFKSHGQAGYNLAYYAHGYEFEYVYDITLEESFLTSFMNTRALRRIDFSLLDDIDDNSYIEFEEE
jgi:hypothetical protein